MPENSDFYYLLIVLMISEISIDSNLCTILIVF